MEVEAAAKMDAHVETLEMMRLNEQQVVERLMAQGLSRDEVMQLRDAAMEYVQDHPEPAKLMRDLQETTSRPTDKMYTSLEEMKKQWGGVDLHVWHEVMVHGKVMVYGIPGGVDGDTQEFNKNNPNSKYTLRCPYSPALQQECFEHFMKQTLEDAEKLAAKSPEHLRLLQECVLTNNNGMGWHRWCMRRAAMLMVAFPETFDRSTLRIGGAGWRLSDGTVHWELG